MSGLQGRVILVTGASSGIGAAIARTLAAEQPILVLTGRDGTRLQGVAEEAKALGATVLTHQAEQTDERERAALVRFVEKKCGRLDGLVLAAGILKMGAIADVTLDDFREMLEVNVLAPYRLLQLCLPLLRSSRGHVVFMNSRAGLRSVGQISQYSATKFALVAIADSLREETVSDGIKISTIYPGRVATPMQEDVHRYQGRPYDPDALLSAEETALCVLHALTAPRQVELSHIIVAPQGAPR